MSLDICKEVFVKPSNIFFYGTSDSGYSSSDVLIVNKSIRSLRFKILSTAHSKYSLSKCKGIIHPEELVKIEIVLSRPQLKEENSKDFFKIQFSDSVDNSSVGDLYVCSTILQGSGNTASNRDSDSCSTWPSRYHDIKSASSSARTASLSRTVGQLCLPHKKVNYLNASLSTLSQPNKGSQKNVKLKSQDKSNSPHNSSIIQQHSVFSFKKLNKAFIDIIYIIAVLLCLIGICSPFISNDFKVWLLSPKIWWNLGTTDSYSTFHSTNQKSQLGFPVKNYENHKDIFDSPDSKQYESFYSSEKNSQSCSASEDTCQDEFRRQTRLAFLALGTAFQSVCRAIIALDPSVAIAHLSWFCLGLLVMYRWKTR